MARRSAVLLVLLAGCLSAPAPITNDPGAGEPTFGGEATKARLPVPDFDFSHVIDPDHGGLWNGHALPELHTGAYGLTLVGYNPMTDVMTGESATGQDSGYGALDTWGRYVCVTHFAGTGGVTIVDIQDLAKPRILSSVDSGMVNSDCQFTDDGNYLLLAAYAGVGTGVPGAPPPAGDAGSNGVLVYDVHDKARPRFLFLDNHGAGAAGTTSSAYHNVFTATINGTIYVFQTYTGNVLSFTPGDLELKMRARVDKSDHDMWVGRHPVTGRWIMITGAGDGTRVYDMEDPGDPKVLGEWEGHDGYQGWHRQWPLSNTVDGHALMLVAGEDCGGGAGLPYTVLDFTDPADLVELGHWQIPNRPVPPPGAHLCELTTHEFESWDGYVATGNYHAGLWLLDIGSMERAREPVALAYYLPHEVAQLRGGTTNKPFYWNPDVWGGYFDERGYVLAADWASGLYVLRFGATAG
jgi:hypothetical protein